ncbi:hypothetical protein UPYG_G00178210 [Umbra pygmaea]|uniref:Dickkopf-related protein 1/2/4 C-terminal subdomain 1 domain-containing protein n=1 Tax=Umbra pygmaea TaxID=75934 RepID=A0ABD0WUL9_UMBPY
MEILAHPDDEKNTRKAAENAACVRSGDCEAGLCCVRYLLGKRCHRIPKEKEVCLLRGRSKLRRTVDRCDCENGLTCRAHVSRKLKGQGICVQKPNKSKRKARYVGRRREAARICE